MENREIEVKIKIDNLKELKDRILKLNPKQEGKSFDEDVYYDYDDRRIRNADKVFRLRNNKIVAFKGPQTGKKVMDREEIEMEVDGDKFREIMSKLGIKPIRKKQKYRETFKFDEGEVLIDETPIGNYLEIEGPEEFIINMTKKLGFSEKDHIIKTYSQLGREYYKKKKVPFDGNMVFKDKKDN